MSALILANKSADAKGQLPPSTCKQDNPTQVTCTAPAAGISGAAAPVGKVTGTVVTVTGLVAGTTYYFKVTAVNRVGEGPVSASASAIPAG